MPSEKRRIVVDGEELTITPTTVADVTERVHAPANTVLVYDDDRIRLLEHTDVVVEHVDAGTALTVLPVAEGYPQLEQTLENRRESDTEASRNG